MARELLPYYNSSESGLGIEGFLNYTNSLVDYWFIPIFLFIFYGMAIYMGTKTEYKMGGWIIFCSLLFGILAMIAQTFTRFNQMTIFVFAIGLIVGTVISFIENAKT